MPDILLFDWRLDKAIENEPSVSFNPRFIPIPDLPLRVMLQAPPPTYAMLQKDPLLHQILVDECKSAFAKSLRTIVPKLEALDAACGMGGGDFYKYAEGRNRTMQQIDQDIEGAKRDALAGIERRWTSIQQQKKDYKSYRLGVGINIAKGAAGLAAAGAGIAGAAATGGATLALSVVGGYRAVMDGGKTLWECIQNADRVQKTVESGLKSLRDTYAKDQKLGVAREVAASTANALFKIPLTNIKTLEDNNTLWRGKLTHLRFLAHELAEALNKLLRDTDLLQAQLSSDPTSSKKQASLKGFQADINKLLTDGFIVVSMGRRVQIQKSHQDAERGLAAQETVTKAIDELKAGRSQAVDWFDKIIGFVADAALTGAGYGVAPPDPWTAKDIGGVVADGASNLKAIYDMAADAAPQVKAFEDNVKKKFAEKVTDKIFGKPVAPPTMA